MANWISITKATLYDTKVAAFIDAADSVQLGTEADRSTAVIADVVAEIRRKIARCNALDVDTTKIPAGLKTLAVDIIVARLKTAIEQELSQDEREGLKKRERELDRIADGKDFIDPPDNPMPSGMVLGIPSPAIKTRHRRMKMGDQEGL